MAKRWFYQRYFSSLKAAKKREKELRKKYGVRTKVETRTVKGRKRYEVYITH